MTEKKKLIVWGGFWDDRAERLQLEEINSHASVACYFLSEALEKYFNVVQVPSFDGIASALMCPDAVGIISCFQAGFTKLSERSPKIFHDLRRAFRGKLASVIDFVSLQRYKEDYLFTVIPHTHGLRENFKHLWSGSKVRYIGWNASAEQCFPEPRNDGCFGIFLDHGHYAGDDYTHVFIGALNRIAEEFGSDSFRVYFQGNNGVEALDFPHRWLGNVYRRSAKVQWSELQAYYRKCSVFCVTHRESAGLGAIEAALAGAQLIVPRIGSSFISENLLGVDVDYRSVECTEAALFDVLSDSFGRTIDQRKAAHSRLSVMHSWRQAAERIATSDFAV